MFAKFSLAVAFSMLAALPASAQLAPGDFRDCLRFIQSQERNLRIPQGLLMSIAYVESGREVSDAERVPWPWTINVNGDGSYFETKDQAVAAVKNAIDRGDRSVDVGCMQINLRYHPNAFRDLNDAFDPAANVAYGAKFFHSLYKLQGSWAKAVERYHSSDAGDRAEYREKVLAFWNDDARKMILSAVAAENTDTPYHHAVRDFAAGRYSQALDKYQGLVDKNPNDRLALLGLAMSFEKLGRTAESQQAFARTLIVEPNNEEALTRLLRIAANQPPTNGRQLLESVVKAGVNRPEILAALGELASASGDNANALNYFGTAISLAPDIGMYHLNAGIAADRLQRTAQAASHYGEFLRIFEANPVITDAPVDGIRRRLRYLSERL